MRIDEREKEELVELVGWLAPPPTAWCDSEGWFW